MNRDITLCAWCYTSLYLVGGHDARRGAYDHERLRRIHDSAKETADLEEREVAATRAELTWVCGAPYSFFSKPLGLPAARNNKQKLRQADHGGSAARTFILASAPCDARFRA